jgi:hypothetical protein
MPCDYTIYTDFERALAESDSHQVANGKHIEVAVDGPGDANRLVIFTGTALVNVVSDNDDADIRRGIARVRLDYPLFKTVHFIQSATNASLASIYNKDDDDQLYAVDCVETDPVDIDPAQPQLGQELILKAALAIQGGEGDTGVSRMAYQANVLLQVVEPELDSLLVAEDTGAVGNAGEAAGEAAGGAIPAPVYQPSVTLDVGNQWLGRVTLTGPAAADLVVELQSDNNLVTVADVPFRQGEMSNDFGPRAVGVPGTSNNVTVTVTAKLKGTTRTATLILRPPSH